MPGVLADMEPLGSAPLKAPEYGFIVSHQKLELELDFSSQTISGRTELTILPQTEDLREIKIDARQCEIPHNGVRVNGSLAAFDHEDPMQALTIPAPYIWSAEQHALQKERISHLTSRQRANGSLEISIPGHVKIVEVDPFSENAASEVTSRALGASAARVSSVALDGTNGAAAFTPKSAAEQSARYQPLTVSILFSTRNFRDGLQFVGVSEGDSRYPHVYTRHSMDPGVACIFPCIDDPAMRCTWDISIKCSRTLGDALKRRPAPERSRGLQQMLARRGLQNSVNNPPDDYEVPLSDDEKLMEMIVVCSGELMTESADADDSSKKIVSFFCSTIVAPHHIGFAIGPFEMVDLSEYREVEDDEKLGQGQTVPVTGYCLPGRAEEVRYICAAMAQGLDWFLLNFGGYPFSDCRFVFVDDQITDTVHAASLSLCSSRLLASEDIKDTSVDSTRTLIHAVASQWMGVSIVPNAPADRWIIVGLSHFMAGIFMKVLCGTNEYSFRQKTLSDRLVELDIDRPSLSALGEHLHLGPFALDFMTLKAPLVIFILDKRIVKTSGSVGMVRVISKLVTAANTGSSIDSVVSTDGFRRLVEKTTKYRQTESFWKQWIEGAGCPRFAISQKFNKKRLCVEMTISQKQDTLPTQRMLRKDSFRREVKEEIYGIYAAELQPLFTGPMTIRIYEADGTPYDHVVEITEGNQKFDIPYNTKYKRLKRSRRQKERLNPGIEINADGGEEFQYHSLGDVLSSANDMREWGLQEWDADTEQRMEQESYEWIRVDADFEWLAEKQFVAMPAYMYVSQLQQDRDVVAQQDSMTYLGGMNSHPLVATFLVRTLMDKRYFHGIRTLAAQYLKTHATKICGWVGLKHLEKAYQFFSCYAGSKMPKPNDFSNGNEKTYKVEMAIIRSLSKVRDTRGNCPKEARHFLFDLLRFNDNSNNEFSDNFKLANILSALTESLIPVKDENNVLDNDDDDEMQDTEPEDFKESVLEELDRYRRMDEWMNSYQNIFTVTVLDCKARLMKAKVIPIDATEFGQYLHDGTGDQIRIKAFESLIDLGFLKNENVAALLLNCLSTDRSPYTRSRLFEVFCLGLASIAFGEKDANEPAVPTLPSGVQPNGGAPNGDAMVLDGGLILEENTSLEERKANILRTTTVDGAITALKEELKGNASFKNALWNAIMSTSIGVGEQVDLLDICGILYEAVDSLIIRLQYPHAWEANVVAKGVIHFQKGNKLRTKTSKHYKGRESPKTAQPAQPAQPVLKISLTNNSTPNTPTPALASAIVVAKPIAPKSVVSPTTKPPPTKIVLTNSMKPPNKRPAPENSLTSEERPSKLVNTVVSRLTIKLKVPMNKVQDIQSFPPNPAALHHRAKSASTKDSSPMSHRPSPGPHRSSITPSPSSTLSNGTVIGVNLPAAVTATVSAAHTPQPKVRRPLPDGSSRTPLPDKTARKPLPDSTPSERKPLPIVTPATTHAAAVAPRKKFILKFQIGSEASSALESRP